MFYLKKNIFALKNAFILCKQTCHQTIKISVFIALSLLPQNRIIFSSFLSTLKIILFISLSLINEFQYKIKIISIKRDHQRMVLVLHVSLLPKAFPLQKQFLENYLVPFICLVHGIYRRSCLQFTLGLFRIRRGLQNTSGQCGSFRISHRNNL